MCHLKMIDRKSLIIERFVPLIIVFILNIFWLLEHYLYISSVNRAEKIVII